MRHRGRVCSAEAIIWVTMGRETHIVSLNG